MNSKSHDSLMSRCLSLFAENIQMLFIYKNIRVYCTSFKTKMIVGSVRLKLFLMVSKDLVKHLISIKKSLRNFESCKRWLSCPVNYCNAYIYTHTYQTRCLKRALWLILNLGPISFDCHMYNYNKNFFKL